MNNYTPAKFWNRIGAILIDAILLGLFGLLLSLFLFDFFVRLGQYGVFIGLIIGLIYFAVGNSRITEGQTVGKYLTKIRVVDHQENYLSISKSLQRSAIILIPYFLAGFFIPGVGVDSMIQIVWTLACTIILFGVVFFYLFNTASRQSLHDIIMKTYVVREYKDDEDEFTPIPAKPLLVYIFGGLSLLIVVFYSYFLFSSNTGLKPLITLREKYRQTEGISDAAVSQNTNTRIDSNGRFTTAILNCSLTFNRELLHDSEKNQVFISAAKLALDNYPDMKSVNYLVITLNRGYNIGIAQSNRSESKAKTPKEWRALIK